MESDARIEQFKKMAQEDPNNELGHFSLGKAYLTAKRFDEAIAPLLRVLELDPTYSKAYQLLGEAHDGSGDRKRAIDVVTRGVTVSDERGDRKPCDAMVKMLEDWSSPVPALKRSDPDGGRVATSGESAEGFCCSRCGRPNGQLTKPPFKGAIGEKIYTNVCSDCFREWVGMGTKVINELGLVLSSEAGQTAYDQYMLEFLQLEEC